ncbi:MAG: hypothetical protein GY869_23500 [Planctomycetes bacterium]|nr:hypothetical protein [Planctomycetota bacterium]
MVLLSKKDAEKLKPAIEAVRRGKFMNPPQQRRGGAIAGSFKIFTAKAQEDGQSDGTVSVKLLDASGAETGDPFDVYILIDKSATDITSGYWPTIATDDIIIILKDREGDYIIIRPDVQESTDDCS